MALLEAERTTNRAAEEQDEAAAIVQMKAVFKLQQTAFAADRHPTLAVRSERLQRMIPMMNDFRDRICDALASDFGVHPPAASDMLEVQPVTARVEYALAHLEDWMQPIPREVDAPYRGGLHAYIKSQPKGVVGNIVPWNFPFEIGFGPLVDMLASGNRVMMKPSEFAPACAELMREMTRATFAEDLVYVAVGDLELARAFSALPFDHLLYTGSSNVGRQIMAGAARNLTPVTLELGGKCPAIMLAGSVTPENVGGILGVKMSQERPDVRLCRSLPRTPGGDGDLYSDSPGFHGTGSAELCALARLYGHHLASPSGSAWKSCWPTRTRKARMWSRSRKT